MLTLIDAAGWFVAIVMALVISGAVLGTALLYWLAGRFEDMNLDRRARLMIAIGVLLSVGQLIGNNTGPRSADAKPKTTMEVASRREG